MDLFRIGGQCGLKPNEVLDMSLDMFQAYVTGYSDRLFDQQVLAVQAGYWAGYYSKAKHPKNIKTILTSMLQQRQRSEKRVNTPAPDVDVEAFLAMEQRFKERLSQ